jgi:MFS family permease
LLYPAGIIADRFHPLRVIIGTSAINLLIAPLTIGFPFICHNLALPTAIRTSIVLSAIGLPLYTLYTAAELPMYMRLLPKERYGQFCSANALIRSIALIFGGIGCGAFLDYTVRFGKTPDACYRFVPVWNAGFQLISLFFLLLLHREWLRLGGLCSYEPPQADLPDVKDHLAVCEPVA